MSMTDRETTARTRKALALVDVLRRAGADPDDLTDDVWTAAEAAAHVRPASSTTRALVVDALRRAPAGPVDPFDGLA